MAIIEVVGGPVTHKYLMGKTKDEIATLYMRLLRETERDAKDAERYRAVKPMFRKNDAYDMYGDGAHWACGFFTHDGRLDLDAAIDALVTPNAQISGAGR